MMSVVLGTHMKMNRGITFVFELGICGSNVISNVKINDDNNVTMVMMRKMFFRLLGDLLNTFLFFIHLYIYVIISILLFDGLESLSLFNPN